MEQAAKNKLKDLLLKAQKRMKESEAQIHEWQAAGIKLPQSSTAPVTPTTTTSAGPVAPTHQSQATKVAQLGANRTTATPTSAGICNVLLRHAPVPDHREHSSGFPAPPKHF